MCTPFPRRQWMVLHFFPRPSANSISIIHRSYPRKGKHDNMCLILTVHPVWWIISVEFKNVIGRGNICLCLCLLQVRKAVSPPHQTVPADIHSHPPLPPPRLHIVDVQPPVWAQRDLIQPERPNSESPEVWGWQALIIYIYIYCTLDEMYQLKSQNDWQFCITRLFVKFCYNKELLAYHIMVLQYYSSIL